jgi:hypothetical protein
MAVKECVVRACAAQAPLETISAFVGQLRHDSQWNDAEIARVQRTVAHIMAEIHRSGE